MQYICVLTNIPWRIQVSEESIISYHTNTPPSFKLRIHLTQDRGREGGSTTTFSVREYCCLPIDLLTMVMDLEVRVVIYVQILDRVWKSQQTQQFPSCE